MPETATPVKILRRAAKLMRERAGLVPPPPWYSAVHDVTTHDGLDVIASSGLTVRAQYVASWHPGVALAVAYASLYGAMAVAERNRPAVQSLVDRVKLYLAGKFGWGMK